MKKNHLKRKGYSNPILLNFGNYPLFFSIASLSLSFKVVKMQNMEREKMTEISSICYWIFNVAIQFICFKVHYDFIGHFQFWSELLFFFFSLISETLIQSEHIRMHQKLKKTSIKEDRFLNLSKKSFVEFE